MYIEMKILHNILFFLSVLSASCSEIPLSDSNEVNNNAVTVYFKAGSEISTRGSDLISSDNRQHVKYVQLYVFDRVTDVCVKSVNVNWIQAVGETARQSYTVKGLTKGKAYTLLAVGLDEEPALGKTTYGFPDAVVVNSTTLSGLKATLAEAEGKIKSDISRSELFSGWEEITAGTTASVTINLYRRVAGVLAYIKGIPEGVTTIRIKIYKNQYKDVPLKKKDKSNIYDAADHGEAELADSRILMSIPVNDATKNNTTLDDGHGYAVTKQAGTVLQGAYVLPMEAPASANDYTLTLETLDAGNNLLKSYPVKVLALRENGSVLTDTLMINYPLYANKIYQLGKKNETTDEPIELGEGIYITVNPDWEEIVPAIPLE